MRTFWRHNIAVMLVGFLATPLVAEKRVALVMATPPTRTFARLGNPANDATCDDGNLERRAGFDVVDSRRNLNIADMRRAFRDFSDKARDARLWRCLFCGARIESTERTTLFRLTRHWSVTSTFTMRHFHWIGFWRR